MENCLISAVKNNDQIFILTIHSFMKKKRVEFDYKDLIVKRAFYFIPKGHLFISEITLPKLKSELSKNN